MRKCTIITYIDKDADKLLKRVDRDSFIICADIGYMFAKEAGITPDLIIADFDSLDVAVPPEIEVSTYPSEKDDTDTGLCVSYAIDHGYDDITIIGGLGGRLDHTIANLQTMKGAKEKGVNIRMLSMGNEVFIQKNETGTYKKRDGYISVFAADTARGVYEKGTKYELTDATLTSSFPLGVSNEIVADEAEITVEDGLIFVIFSEE